MKRIKITGPISLTILIIAAVFITSGCNGTTDRITVEQADYLLSSYYMLRGDDEIAESRAAWNATTDEITFPSDSTPATGTKNNYPERGQKTTVSIEMTALTDVYKVTSVTEYPKKDEISSTTEIYYVKDDDGSGEYGVYDSADYICDAAGDRNDNLRSSYETVYDNGTVRYEEILESTADDGFTGVQYDTFDIDDEMTFPVTDSEGNWDPAENLSADWSSKIVYIQQEGSLWDIWSDYKLIVGVRYYTEVSGIKTSVSYEKCVERQVADEAVRSKIGTFKKRILNDSSTKSGLIFPGTTLSETVIRYEINASGKKSVKTQTQVYDLNSDDVATFAASFIQNADGTITSEGEPEVTYP